MQKALNRIQNCSCLNKINQVILYGSCAGGEEKFTSDVDLVVVFRANSGYTKKDMRTMRMAINEDSDVGTVDVDVHFLDSADITTSKSTYVNEIRKDGIIIYKCGH